MAMATCKGQTPENADLFQYHFGIFDPQFYPDCELPQQGIANNYELTFLGEQVVVSMLQLPKKSETTKACQKVSAPEANEIKIEE
jgi:hypothetical protein